MPRLVEVWECDTCRGAFPSRAECEACEQRHDERKSGRRLELMAKYFPLKHINDTDCEKHCVDCGKLLIQWERTEGGTPFSGKMTFAADHQEIMHGRRCQPCATKLINTIVDALDLASQSF